MKNILSCVETITPDKAREILKMNAFNRTPNDRHIKGLAEQMEKGEWKLTGEGVIISDDGFLLDGQHRLKAVIESNTCVEMLVVRGTDKETFRYIDTGKNRSAKDVLSMKGFKNTSKSAALAKAIILFDKGQIAMSSYSQGVGIVEKVVYGVTNSDILDYVKDNEQTIIDCIKLAMPNYDKGKFIGFNDWALLHYILGKKSVEDSVKFLSKLSSGFMMEEGEALLVVRNKLIEARNLRRSYTQRVKLGMIFKAWNVFRQNKVKGNTKFSPNEELPKLL